MGGVRLENFLKKKKAGGYLLGISEYILNEWSIIVLKELVRKSDNCLHCV